MRSPAVVYSSLLAAAALQPVVPQTAQAAQVGVPIAELQQNITKALPKLLELYKDLHMHPELGRHEVRTRGRVAERLKGLGCEVIENLGTYTDGSKTESVIGIMRNGPGPTILVRGDMDALPIQEETGVPYASQNKGVMHACGHDVHTTVLVGTAELMAKLKDRWSGTILFVGQPAEETGQGAKALIEGGLYAKAGRPDLALGIHVQGDLPTGAITARPGPTMAGIDTLRVTLRGKGAHGSAPHLGVDTTILVGDFIAQLQTIASRNTPPIEPVAVTIGSIHGGKAPNVIAPEYVLELTARAYNDDVRKTMLDAIKRIANGVTATAGSPSAPTVELIDEHIPPVINDEQKSGELRDLLKREAVDVRNGLQIMAGDDFSRYSAESVPTVYFRMGVTEQSVLDDLKKRGLPAPINHTSTFLPVADKSIMNGITTFSVALTSLLKK